MVLRTFNFWGFCGQYRDFHYYFNITSKDEIVLRAALSEV